MKNKTQGKRFECLDIDDRIQIEIQYSQGRDLGEIAKHLGKSRNKSTISREIAGIRIVLSIFNKISIYDNE